MARAVLFVSLLVLLLAGCQGPVGDVDALKKDIEAAGYAVNDLQYDRVNREDVFVIDVTMLTATDNELFDRHGERLATPTGDLSAPGPDEVLRIMAFVILVPLGIVVVGLVVLVYVRHRRKVGGGRL